MKKPPFKVIAVDMDGTFLNDQKQFNHQLFEQVLAKCQEHGVRFVVATGDPLPLIQKHFADYVDQVMVVSENGAQISQGNQIMMTKTLDREMIKDLMAYLVEEMHLNPVLAGTKCGYFLKNGDQAVYDHLRKYFLKASFVDNWTPLPDDEFFQVSFLLDDQDVPKAEKELQQQFGNILEFTPSGNGSMDITQPGINKGWALQRLLNDWGLGGDNLAAFGDGGNDVSMLKLARHSFAMPNGGRLAKQAADNLAVTDNNHDGVLKTILNYFD